MEPMLSSLRTLMAMFALLCAPPALLIWLIIHPLAHVWRRLGAAWSWLCFLSLMGLLDWGIWQIKDGLLGIEYGTHFALMVLAAICFCGSGYLASKRVKQLSWPAVLGIPEISSTVEARRLVSGGVYALVRNPRYLETAVFMLGCAFFANYAVVYATWLAGLPILHLVVLLEERELYQAFGTEYSDYCERVPRYLPKRSGE
jgi:protein-S-isoprenylcysteine O-methyltransferase Ste14